MRAIHLLLVAALLGGSPSGALATTVSTRPSALAIEHIDASTSALRWTGPAGTFRARAVKLSPRGVPRPATSRVCTAEVSVPGEGRCSVARLGPGRWQIRVTNLTSSQASWRVKSLWVPIMDGLPTTFAPCAGTADTVKEAAYNCLRDWEPAAHPPVNVVYHYSRSVTSEYKAKTKAAIDFAIDRLAPILRITAPNPNLHIFVIHDGANACKRMAQSWEGTRDQTWMWDTKFRLCNAAGEGDPRQGTGHGVSTDLGNTGSAWTRVPPERGDEGVWIVMGEAVHELIALSVEKSHGSSFLYTSLNQRWLFYATPTIISSAYNIQVDGAGLDSFNVLSITAGRATWVPTFTDHNFCPSWVPYVGRTPYSDSCSLNPDIELLMKQLPWNYTLYGRAMEFLVAYFGPEWLQSVYYPLLYDEYEGQDGNFRETHDRIARRIWGGKWSDLEASMDRYLIEELKRGGVTGLK